MNKRVVSRGIILMEDKVVLLKRIRKDGSKYLHYYAIPGGGVEESESLEEACIREIKEEVSLDVKIDKYLGSETYDTGICHYYKTSYISGTLELGGEEKEKSNPDNYYEINLIPISKLDNIFIYGSGVEMIKKALENDVDHAW